MKGNIVRGAITLAILEKLAEVSLESTILFVAYLKAGYGASYSRLNYEKNKLREKMDKTALELQAKINYSKLIYKLKREGFVKGENKNNKKYFFITEKGKSKLAKLLKRGGNLPRRSSYQKIKGDNLIIITFDIPETERRKRDWLRSSLKELNFKIVQKSVWIGKTKIPPNFLEDLYDLKLVDCVEIFEVSKTGTLKNLFL